MKKPVKTFEEFIFEEAGVSPMIVISQGVSAQNAKISTLKKEIFETSGHFLKKIKT